MSPRPLPNNEDPWNFLQEIIKALDEKIKALYEKIKALYEKIKALYDSNSDKSPPDVFQRLPNEILGCIFDLIIPPRRDYSLCHTDELFIPPEKGTYDFLSVCKRWNAVALTNPRVRNFWGKNLEACCVRTGNIPIDLVLVGRQLAGPKELTDTVLNALRARAAQDQILRIHLRDRSSGEIRDGPEILRMHLRDISPGRIGDPLDHILSSLTPGDEKGQPPQDKRIESIVLRADYTPGKLQQFFARTSLPSLKYLEIYERSGSGAQLWISLNLHRTTGLTCLSLNSAEQMTDPVRYPLLEILRANPDLQELSLGGAPPNTDHNSDAKVSLPQLRRITLEGRFGPTFALLQALDLPAGLHTMCFTTNDPTLSLTDIRTCLGPYMQSFFQSNAFFKDLLSVTSYRSNITVHPFSMQGPEPPCAKYLVSGTITGGLDSWHLAINLMDFIPLELVRSWAVTTINLEVPEKLLINMTRLDHLSLENITLSNGFLQPDPNGPNASRKVFPSLKNLSLEDVITWGGNWQPLIDFLKTRQPPGCQPLDGLDVMSKYDHIPEGVIEEIQNLVGDFLYQTIRIPPDQRE